MVGIAAGADEEGPREVGGLRRVPNLPVDVADPGQSTLRPCRIHESDYLATVKDESSRCGRYPEIYLLEMIRNGSEEGRAEDRRTQRACRRARGERCSLQSWLSVTDVEKDEQSGIWWRRRLANSKDSSPGDALRAARPARWQDTGHEVVVNLDCREGAK